MAERIFMASNIRDMTSGKPAKLLVEFALPLMVGNILQQLYTMVDTIVVGRGIGVQALAALGAVDWLNWMILNIIIGFAQGFSILVSQFFGAGDQRNLRKAVSMSALLGVILAVVTTVASELAAVSLLHLLNTPEDIIGMATQYIRVSFAGIIVVMAYNVLSSTLRAMGDSKTPLHAMAIAAAINVVLDVLFVIVLGMGIASAAVATLIAQIFSCIYCFIAIKKIPALKLTKSDWEPEYRIITKLLKLGTPMAFQNVTIAIGGLIVQSVVNGYGFIFVAGFTATNKLYGLLELAATSFGFSMATFAGQNLGAGKVHRIKEGMRSGIFISFLTSAVMSAIVILFGRQIAALFVSGDPEQVAAVVSIAYQYLFIMGSMLFILYLLYLYRSAIQGMGDTIIPMLSGVAELIMRIAAVMLLPRLMGQQGVFYAEIAAWIGADLILITAYYIKINRLSKRFHQPSGE